MGIQSGFWVINGFLIILQILLFIRPSRGGARNFCLGGPSATLIHLLRQLPHTCIYTYARFFIIYTHFLFDKLYIYTQKKGV